MVSGLFYFPLLPHPAPPSLHGITTGNYLIVFSFTQKDGCIIYTHPFQVPVKSTKMILRCLQ